MTINRFCSSGLQTIAMATERITCGHADTIFAGGTESMSLIPMGGVKIFRPIPYIVENYPEYYLSMGLTAEKPWYESTKYPDWRQDSAFCREATKRPRGN